MSVVPFFKFLVLPACAGVIPVLPTIGLTSLGFTRMRGGDPKLRMDIFDSNEFYPHARG